jgi:hypothetical protein
METPNAASLMREWAQLGASPRDMHRALRTFNAAKAPFLEESLKHGD